MTELLNKTNQKKYIYEKTFASVLQIHNTKSIKAKNFEVFISPKSQQLLELVWHCGLYDIPVSQRVIQKRISIYVCLLPTFQSTKLYLMLGLC